MTRNRANILPKAIESVLAQSAQNVRIRIFDDASTDSTSGLVQSFATIDWQRLPDMRGYMYGRNQLMGDTAADYFVSLDDDAWFLDGDEIAVATDFLENNPKAGAVAFDIVSPDRPRRNPRRSPRPVAMFIGCGHMLRLSAVRAVGMYESTPGSYGGEEKDLCLRLLDAGYETVLLPGVHVWHDKSAIARDGAEQHTSGVCNDLVMAFRRTPGILLPFAMLAKFYRHIIFSSRHGFTRPCLRGFLLFVRSLPALVSTRRPVRAATLRSFLRLAKARQ